MVGLARRLVISRRLPRWRELNKADKASVAIFRRKATVERCSRSAVEGRKKRLSEPLRTAAFGRGRVQCPELKKARHRRGFGA